MEIKRHSDGSYLVEVALPEWESFFHQYGLKAIGSGEREGITSQLQVGGVYKDALTSDPPKPTEKRGQHNLLKKMHLHCKLVAFEGNTVTKEARIRKEKSNIL